MNSEESPGTSEAFLSLTRVGTSLLSKSPIAALEFFRDNRRPRGDMGPVSPPAHIAAMGDCLARQKGDDSPPAPSLGLGQVAESACPKSLISRAREFRVSSCWRNLFEPRVRGFVTTSSKGLGFIQGTAMGLTRSFFSTRFFGRASRSMIILLHSGVRVYRAGSQLHSIDRIFHWAPRPEQAPGHKRESS